MVRKQQDKLIISIISGLTFFVIANPETFRWSGECWDPDRDPYWLPLYSGLIVHSIVFILVVWGMMNVKKDLPDLPNIKSKGC